MHSQWWITLLKYNLTKKSFVKIFFFLTVDTWVCCTVIDNHYLEPLPFTFIISENFILHICRQEVKYRLACENSTFQLNWTALESKVLQITKKRLKLSSRAVVQLQVSRNGKVNRHLNLILHECFFMWKDNLIHMIFTGMWGEFHVKWSYLKWYRYRCKCLCCRVGWVWWWGPMMSQRSPWAGWPCWVTLSRLLCRTGRGDPLTCPSSPTSQSPPSKSPQTCRLLMYFI